MMIFFFLLHSISQIPQPPSSPVYIVNREWYEFLLEQNTLIPVLVGIAVAMFLFLFIFRYCYRERSESLTNVIDSLGVAISRIRGKSISEREKDSIVYVESDEDKKKQQPSLKLK